MKLIELHILQSYPVSCLNRDDLGSPKSAVFGGVNRARLSSQCLKRAVREYAKSEFATLPFHGIRSRFLIDGFTKALLEAGVAEAEAKKQATAIAETFSKLEDEKKRSAGDVTTAVFLSPGEMKSIATSIAKGEDVKKAVKNAQRLDAADIALFGRMIANDSSLNVEAAALFGHALSVHRSEPELDFFSAIDENKRDAEGTTDAGAGMIGTLEFNSACYYRYCALNLDLLAQNLNGLEADKLQAVVAAFLTSVIRSVPGARETTMNANTVPSFVLGTFKKAGQPVQLVNAFESAIRSGDEGFVKPAIKELEAQLTTLKDTWAVTFDAEARIPSGSLADFISTLTAHIANVA
jgi:CRISPR system Cascade subunit CasC